MENSLVQRFQRVFCSLTPIAVVMIAMCQFWSTFAEEAVKISTDAIVNATVESVAGPVSALLAVPASVKVVAAVASIASTTAMGGICCGCCMKYGKNRGCGCCNWCCHCCDGCCKLCCPCCDEKCLKNCCHPCAKACHCCNSCCDGCPECCGCDPECGCCRRCRACCPCCCNHREHHRHHGPPPI